MGLLPQGGPMSVFVARVVCGLPFLLAALFVATQ